MIVTPKEDVASTKGFNVPTKVLTKGKEYVVYAIYLRRGKEKTCLVFSDVDLDYPEGFDINLFGIKSNEKPSEWVLSKKRGLFAQEQVFSFEEWANDPNYYQYLLDDDLHPEESKNAQQLMARKIIEYGSVSN